MLENIAAASCLERHALQPRAKQITRAMGAMVRSGGAEWETAGHDRDAVGQLASPGRKRRHGRSTLQTTAMRGRATPVAAAPAG